ncbi:feruloyl-CoA synthase [Variovorax dokdonensis]|uniref:Feruloyl-CoA synthase n=1 Tax=Variovorax dokdonensis TaxID=344883 RepID=A0ABT7N7F1_9BURK|nr:feruloyl-CoA synthase [Variovorax dokdonensis]MDM0043869.1 feruloyl-CoA synthase [Variovorax dokdonensis]
MSHSLLGFEGALASPGVVREDRADGSFILRNEQPLQPFDRCIGDWLDHWRIDCPDALFLAERGADGQWIRLNYGVTRERVGRIAQGLLQQDLPADKPIVIVSDNAIDHALLSLAAMYIGRVSCTVSSAYTRLAKSWEKIHGILDMLEPAMVYASDEAVYGPALQAWAGSAPRYFSRLDAARQGTSNQVRSFADLESVNEGPMVARLAADVRPQTPAKYLLTSGSTGMPKVVINTHGMLCANQQQIAQVWPFLGQRPLVLLEWLPWSHTFGANHNFNMVLKHGGALYIDEGRPAPGLIEKTLANLRDVRPNFHFNVPKGFDMLLPFLEQDAQAAHEVFERLDGLFYAGAALPQSTWERLEAVARSVRERPVWFTSAWGATETAPAITTVHWHIERAGCIGAPLPGCEVKLVPNGEKLEMRVKGPQVFPGYRNAPALTAAAFDDEGFYCIGDAGRLVDAHDPSKGIAFDGRVAEDFKLTTGTWVSVGGLRLKAVTAMSPYVADAVVTGHDRDEIGLLLFLSPQGRQADRDTLCESILGALRSMRAVGTGSSQSPGRALLLDDMPAMEAGEITDKGYINQRAVLQRRAAEVEALHANRADPRVVAL